MQTIEREYTIKTINEGIENGNIVFNHPMQRKPGQWNDEQQSLLIHSILANFAVPQTYALQMFDGDYDSFSVLDGKQRLTTIYEYMKDGFKLSEDTPTVNIQKRVAVIDENGQRKQKISVEEYEIVKKVVTNAEENDIILLHDCYNSSVNAAFRIIDILQEKGFEFVTVDELFLN